MALAPLAQILNHAAKAVDRLAAQFTESPLFKGMITAIGNEVQTLEDGLWGLLVTRDIDNATGQTLANIARLVGAPPQGAKTTTEFRNRIKAQVIANRSDGAPGVVYQVSKRIIPAWDVNGQPKVTEQTHATYEIHANPKGALVNTIEQGKELARLLDDVNPAGVRGIVISQSIAASAAFSFANGPGQGFGDGAFVGAYDGNQ